MFPKQYVNRLQKRVNILKSIRQLRGQYMKSSYGERE